MMGDRSNPLIAHYMRSTIRSVGEAFVLWGSLSLILDVHGRLHFAIAQRLKSYFSINPPQKQQAAIPLVIFRKAERAASSTCEEILTHLMISAFFFRMQSCEYLLVKGTHKTKM